MRWLSRSRTTGVTEVARVPTRKGDVTATSTPGSWGAPVSGNGAPVSGQPSKATSWLIAAVALTTWAPGLHFAQAWSFDHQEWAQDYPSALPLPAAPLDVGAVLCAGLALRCSSPEPRWRRPVAATVLAVTAFIWLIFGLGMLFSWAYSTGGGG